MEYSAKELIPFEPEKLDFPITELPLPVLSTVLYHLPLNQIAHMARTNQMFYAAWKDEKAWQRRCQDAGVMEQSESSWMETYLSSRWTIRVVSKGFSWGNYFVSHDFSVRVFPSMKVKEFLHLLIKHPRNRNHCSMDSFTPHHPKGDPKHLKEVRNSPLEALERPNCTFDLSCTGSIQEAGLCDGAVLEQPETRFVD
jgi:hypothetical protein